MIKTKTRPKVAQCEVRPSCFHSIRDCFRAESRELPWFAQDQTHLLTLLIDDVRDRLTYRPEHGLFSASVLPTRTISRSERRHRRPLVLGSVHVLSPLAARVGFNLCNSSRSQTEHSAICDDATFRPTCYALGTRVDLIHITLPEHTSVRGCRHRSAVEDHK